jgi:predicted O-methyltransferase YrrM
VELDPQRVREAELNLADAGLTEAVTLRTGDAGLELQASGDSTWDLIFLDSERTDYAGYWPDLVRALRPGGLLVVDNAISHAEEVAELRALAAGDERVMDALVHTGAGALLVVRER